MNYAFGNSRLSFGKRLFLYKPTPPWKGLAVQLLGCCRSLERLRGCEEEQSPCLRIRGDIPLYTRGTFLFKPPLFGSCCATPREVTRQPYILKPPLGGEVARRRRDGRVVKEGTIPHPLRGSSLYTREPFYFEPSLGGDCCVIPRE